MSNPCHLVTKCRSEIVTGATTYPKCCKGTTRGNYMHDCSLDLYRYYVEGTIGGGGTTGNTAMRSNCNTLAGVCDVLFGCTISTPREKC